MTGKHYQDLKQIGDQISVMESAHVVGHMYVAYRKGARAAYIAGKKRLMKKFVYLAKKARSRWYELKGDLV